MGAYERQTGACVAPTLAGTATALGYTEGEAAKAVDPGIAITDPDSASMASAVVILTNPQAGDELAGSGTVSAAKDAVTFSAATKEALAAALAGVTYRSTSSDPSTAPRSVMFRVNDGNADSNVVTRTVTVTAVAPEVDAPDVKAPVISAVSRAARRITLTLSEAASVTARYSIRRVGRKVGKRCRKPTRANRNRKRCARHVRVATTTTALPAGATSLRIPAAVKKGRFRVRLIAKDSAGNASAPPVTFAFRLRR
jgi:hypothetical protein